MPFIFRRLSNISLIGCFEFFNFDAVILPALCLNETSEFDCFVPEKNQIQMFHLARNETARKVYLGPKGLGKG